jgi:hypothetical protein
VTLLNICTQFTILIFIEEIHSKINLPQIKYLPQERRKGFKMGLPYEVMFCTRIFYFHYVYIYKALSMQFFNKVKI